MKKLIVLLSLLLCSSLVFSQALSGPQGYGKIEKRYKALNFLGLPVTDTICDLIENTSNGTCEGAVVWRTLDLSLWVKGPDKWYKIATGSDLADYYTKSELQTPGFSLVNFANISGMSSPKLIGRGSVGTGMAEEISIGNGLTLSTSGVLTGLSLNGQTGATQTFSVGTSGTNFAINSSGNNHVFSLPDASATARGAVTTSAQTFAGSKTFGNNINVQNVPAMGSAASVFLTLNSSVLNTRTTAQVLSDIGGAPAAGSPNYAPISGSTNYIWNGSSPQTAAFWVTGLGLSSAGFEVWRNGSAGFFPQYNMKDAGGSQRGGIQLTEEATPGMSFWVDGLEKLRIQSDGDVGIGTSSPASKLEISGTSGITAQALQSASGNNLTLWAQGATQSIILAAGSTSAELMRLTPNGNIAVGVTVPFGSFHVKRPAALMNIQNTNAYSGSSGGSIYMLNSGTPSAANQKIGGIIMAAAPTDANPQPGAMIDAFTEGAGWTVGSSIPTYMRFLTGGTSSGSPVERMRVTGTGNLLIGTTTDGGQKLQVNGTASVQKAVVTTPTAYDITHNNQSIAKDATTNELVPYDGAIADYVTLSTNTTLNTAEYYIKSNSTAYTVTVPSASANPGRVYVIKNSGNTTNDITLNVTTNSQTIDGVNTNVAITPGVWIRIMSNGTAWFKVGG